MKFYNNNYTIEVLTKNKTILTRAKNVFTKKFKNKQWITIITSWHEYKENESLFTDYGFIGIIRKIDHKNKYIEVEEVKTIKTYEIEEVLKT